eukprot:2015561-Pyramimonas_sp.AAC.1
MSNVILPSNSTSSRAPPKRSTPSTPPVANPAPSTCDSFHCPHRAVDVSALHEVSPLTSCDFASVSGISPACGAVLPGDP